MSSMSDIDRIKTITYLELNSVPKPVDQAKVQKMIDELGDALKW